MPKTRTTHVRRIKNTDDEEVWIDVERVDKIVSKQEGQGGLYRLTTRIMEWLDEASEEPPVNRKTTKLRIEQPDAPETFVEIYVIDKQKTRRGQGPDYKRTWKWFSNNKEANTVRKVSLRRVYHWDTATDPNDDGGTEYIRIDGTEDRSQYVDVAVIEHLIQKRGQGPGYKRRTYQFNTAPIKAFSEPSPKGVDPTTVVWLDPFQNIVNVQWGGYRLVAYLIAQHGDVQFAIQFAGPKAHYTIGELSELERNGDKVQVPTFGELVSVPTGTISQNGVYPAGITETITGDRLVDAAPSSNLNFRGYTTLRGNGLALNPTTGIVTSFASGENVYFDFNWQPIAAGDIPEGSERGAALTSNDDLTVYVRLNTGDDAGRGVTAYDRSGNVLWRIRGDIFDRPDAVNYDRETELIALTYFSLPESGTPGVEFYGLNGIRTSVTDLGEDYTPGDVSRNGKLYLLLESEDEDTTESIVGLGPTGELLWTIPGEDVITGWDWGGITAYGEDYIVVSVVQGIADIEHDFGSLHNAIRVYDAHTGELVSETEMTDDILTREVVVVSPTETTTTINQESYGQNLGVVRSAYWP